MSNKSKKLSQLLELDWIKINLDALISDKRKLVFFQGKSIIALYLNRIFRLHQIKIFFFIIIRIITRYELMNNFIKKYHYSYKETKKQTIFILPGKIKHEQTEGFSILVILHVYHVDELEKILTYLQNIPGKYHLCITTNDVYKKAFIIDRLTNVGMVNYEIKICQNRGRDIAPMFVEFQAKMDSYEYMLHIHTKKSPHDSELEGWSEYLYENLIGSRELVLSILNIFERHTQMGMIAPAHFDPLTKGNHLSWGDNFQICKNLLRKMGHDIYPFSHIVFPSGSMFWARTNAIKPLCLLNLQYEDFPFERGQKDGTLAHAIERLLFFSCEISGYVWIQTRTPTVQKSSIIEINSEDLFELSNKLIG